MIASHPRSAPETVYRHGLAGDNGAIMGATCQPVNRTDSLRVWLLQVVEEALDRLRALEATREAHPGCRMRSLTRLTASAAGDMIPTMALEQESRSEIRNRLSDAQTAEI